MKNKEKHNHHFSSKLYLRYWANDENKVWVYELSPSDKNRRPNPNLLHIDKACSDYHLFSIGEDHNKIEDWSDKYFETPSAKTFEKLNAKGEIDKDDIFDIKAFLALTIARNPVLKESSQTIVDAFPQRNKILNPLAQTIPLRTQANLSALDQLNLQVLYISNDIDASFITSDIPFVISWESIKEKFLKDEEIVQIYKDLRRAGDKRTKEEIFGEKEITRKTFERVWFPISPKTLVFLSKAEASSFYEEITDVAHVSNINSGILSYARDIIIMNDKDVFNSLPKFQKVLIKE
jgi:hypothetical protein